MADVLHLNQELERVVISVFAYRVVEKILRYTVRTILP
jgi:hypothetical protein